MPNTIIIRFPSTDTSGALIAAMRSNKTFKAELLNTHKMTPCLNTARKNEHLLNLLNVHDRVTGCKYC